MSGSPHILRYLKSGEGEAEPTPQGRPEQFPISAFPVPLRLLAENMAAVYQIPFCLPAMSALAILSGAVGRSVAVDRAYKDRQTMLNLYVMPVAERGSGKGVVGEILCKPLAERSKELAETQRRRVADMQAECGVLKKELNAIEQKAATAKGPERDRMLSDCGSKTERLKQLERDASIERTMLINDTTSEALARLLEANNEELFSFSAEAGAAVQVVLGKYTDGAGDINLLLSAFSGDSYRADRVSRRPVQLTSPRLSLLWLVQDIVMRRLVDDREAFSRGLTARILIFDSGAKREKDDRSNMELTQAEAWRSLIDGVLNQRLSAGGCRSIKCTPEAREVFAVFHDLSVELEREQYADLKGELSRWREIAIKVAGLFAIAEGLEEVTADLAERAVQVVHWCGFSYLALLQSGRREKQREELSELVQILMEHGGQVNLGPLNSKHGWGPDRIAAVMAAHPGRLVKASIPQPNGPGRPAQVLKLAPAVLES